MDKQTKKTSLILLSILLISVVSLSLASAYICIDMDKDNDSVKQFKSRTNYVALKNDVDSGLTKEAIGLKLKYFSPCNV